MWKHILKNQVGGKFFKAVYNMYKNAKSCIKNCSNLGYFPCSSGVRQGENLSPIVFALYLCDLEACLKSRYNGLPTLRDVL